MFRLYPVALAALLGLILASAAGAEPAPAAPGSDATGVVAAPTAFGDQPWVVLLCEYADSVGDPTFDAAYTTTMFQDPAHGLASYFDKISYGKVALTAAIHDYKNMPYDRQHYIDIVSADDRAGALFDDCTAAHDADVNYNDYTGILILLDKNIGFGGLGGSHLATLDGTDKYWPYATTGAHSTQGFNEAVTAHEMLHAFGLPHSRGGSFFDVMSVPGAWCPDPFNNPYTCYPQYTNAWHAQELLGWIDAPKVYQAGPGKTPPITIERLALPRSNSISLVTSSRCPSSSNGVAAHCDSGEPCQNAKISSRRSRSPSSQATKVSIVRSRSPMR